MNMWASFLQEAKDSIKSKKDVAIQHLSELSDTINKNTKLKTSVKVSSGIVQLILHTSIFSSVEILSVHSRSFCGWYVQSKEWNYYCETEERMLSAIKQGLEHSIDFQLELCKSV